MAEIQSTGGHGGRVFAGGGDRRFRHHHHQPQELKCPRCDSLNTKFCYYNNYNLSQPRHFCKSCRRYWTNGGVLRNVPVGGGIRKTKRSNTAKPKSGTNSVNRKSSIPENSGSDSSSLTTMANRTAITVPRTSTKDESPEILLNFNESSTHFFSIPNSSSTPITNFDPLNQLSVTGKTSTDIRTFTGMMTSSTDQLRHEFNRASGVPTSFQLHQRNPDRVVEDQNTRQNQSQWTVDATGFMDQTAKIDLPGFGSRRSNGGLAGTEDWQDSTDEGFFNLIGTVDQSYWNQSQWDDDAHDHHLNYFLT